MKAKMEDTVGGAVIRGGGKQDKTIMNRDS